MSDENKQRNKQQSMYQQQMQGGSYYPGMMYQPGYTQQQPVYYPSYGYPPYQTQSPPQDQPSMSQLPGMLPLEESYIENILRLNKGKIATIYMTFENNDRWNAKIFKGIIEAAGRDHIILSDPETNKRYLLLTIYLDYITFDEEINYDYPRSQRANHSYKGR
ncbi:Spore coat protein GerQ [Paraliobacillus sp. PM-2]|uniref:spore coat protein GerQ n=1 Tax=Paraliobacillus sp. PM-2 TaxID=1462524 RepID=UPI00061B910A|nr:spore coat protein GerQ [Paraliobacillus sp. PM-2]CQR46122.1 Spore coat protein GerQ [Paraliobacillus sp. PM-2]